MDILKLQLDTIYDSANYLLDNLNPDEGLYIFDKDMNIRILFYYNNSEYFVSDKFLLKDKYKNIMYTNNEELKDICTYISLNFDTPENVINFKLVKDIDDFLDNIILDSFVLKVNRQTHTIIEILSFEYDNNLFLINENDTYLLDKINDAIYKIRVGNGPRKNNKDYIIKHIKSIYKQNTNKFPNSISNSNQFKLTLNDFNEKSILIMINTRSRRIVFYELININDINKEYILIIILQLLNIDKNNNNLLDQITDLLNLNEKRMLN